jgi:ribulose kinase
MLVVALDVGTSSARARVFDAEGRALPGAEGHVAYEPSTTPDGGVERVVIRRKANAATGAAHEIIEALAKECDLVFAGSAD